MEWWVPSKSKKLASLILLGLSFEGLRKTSGALGFALRAHQQGAALLPSPWVAAACETKLAVE